MGKRLVIFILAGFSLINYITLSKINENQTLIEVRVGTSETGKASAENILKSIAEYLSLI